MSFTEAQTFYLDPATFGNAKEVGVSKIRVWFKTKPHPTSNKSGIRYPGAIMYIVPTDVNGNPDVSGINSAPFTRVEYTDITTSSDASDYTDFVFKDLAETTPGKEWAFVLKYDGAEDFVTWTARQGHVFVGTTNPFPGPAGKHIGRYFTYGSPTPRQNGNQTVANSGLVSVPQNSPRPGRNQPTSWYPHSAIDMKFQVYVARYRINGSDNLASAVPNTIPASVAIKSSGGKMISDPATGTVAFHIPARRYEYLVYDRRQTRLGNIRLGERAWQKQPFYPDDKAPFTVSCTTGSDTITCTGFDFNSIFVNGADEEHIVLYSKDHSVVGEDKVCLRKVISVSSNNQIKVDHPVTISNTAALFYKAAVASLHDIDQPGVMDEDDDDFIVFVDSTANTSCRFANHALESCSITVGGSGYSNTDYVLFTGFESVAGKVLGGYAARAVLTTNSTGGVTNLHFSNLGCGFVNSAAITPTFYAANGSASNGTGCSLGSYEVGMTVLFEHAYRKTDGYIKGARLINLDAHDIFVPTLINNPMGSFFTYKVRFCYEKVKDNAVFGGHVYYLDDADSTNDYLNVVPGKEYITKFQKRRVICSWSRELTTPYRTGAISNGAGVQANAVAAVDGLFSNGSTVVVTTTSNSDFVCIKIPPMPVTYSKRIINNDYTDEHTNYGNASAKGITTKLNFANNAFAEDLRVYLTAYRPSGTDMKVYCRIHNSNDSEAFDDKDWTLLVQTDGIGVFSSQTNVNDYVELGYGFPQFPNVAITLDGTATTTLNSATITGSGTTFSSNLAVNDVVRIYQPLFPNNHVVALVTAVPSATSMTINRAISNNSLVGNGLKIQKIGFKHQAFNNIQSENVVRYYSTSMTEYDKFNTMQFKVVFLSTDETIIPRVDDIRAVGVSA